MAEGNDALVNTVKSLAAGRIVAIKGLGGFHLACDATNEEAVRSLRKRKDREEKPLAVMVSDIDAARHLCMLSPMSEEALSSPAAPIIIARARNGNGIAASVAPSTSMLGA